MKKRPLQGHYFMQDYGNQMPSWYIFDLFNYNLNTAITYMFDIVTVQDRTKLFVSRFSGNEALQEITSHGNNTLKIVLSDWTGVTKVAEYSTFHIGNENDGYRLTVGAY